jgi:hypothetical protein
LEEQQQTGHKDMEAKLYEALINHMNDEVKVQTELKETLKWHGIIGGTALTSIAAVIIWFNVQQIDTKVLIEKTKGKMYYLEKVVKKHLDTKH